MDKFWRTASCFLIDWLISAAEKVSKKISKIWHSEYYIVNVQPDGKRKATCKFCHAKFYMENASKMQDHILQYDRLDEETRSPFQPSKRLRQCKPSPCPVQQSNAPNVSFSSIPWCSSRWSPWYGNATNAAGSQTSVQGFIDRMGQDQQDDVNKAFPRWIYSANLPLSVTENPFFQEFAQKVRPAWKCPSRFQLTNNILEVKLLTPMQ